MSRTLFVDHGPRFTKWTMKFRDCQPSPVVKCKSIDRPINHYYQWIKTWTYIMRLDRSYLKRTKPTYTFPISTLLLIYYLLGRLHSSHYRRDLETSTIWNSNTHWLLKNHSHTSSSRVKLNYSLMRRFRTECCAWTNFASHRRIERFHRIVRVGFLDGPKAPCGA